MRFLIANCPVGLSQHRTSGEFIAASEACERLLGRSQTELVGLALFGLISDDSGERHRDYLVRMTPGLVWFGPVSPDLTSYRAVYISEYLFRVTGYTAKQWMETPGFWRSIIHPEDRERIVQDAPTAMAEERPIGPYRIIANDGRILWIKSQILIERDAAGVPVRMHGLTLDMTSFQQAETERVRLRETLADQAQRLLELSTPLIPISEDARRTARPMPASRQGARTESNTERAERCLCPGATLAAVPSVRLEMTAEFDAPDSGRLASPSCDTH